MEWDIYSQKIPSFPQVLILLSLLRFMLNYERVLFLLKPLKINNLVTIPRFCFSFLT